MKGKRRFLIRLLLLGIIILPLGYLLFFQEYYEPLYHYAVKSQNDFSSEVYLLGFLIKEKEENHNQLYFKCLNTGQVLVKEEVDREGKVTFLFFDKERLVIPNREKREFVVCRKGKLFSLWSKPKPLILLHREITRNVLEL